MMSLISGDSGCYSVMFCYNLLAYRVELLSSILTGLAGSISCNIIIIMAKFGL